MKKTILLSALLPIATYVSMAQQQAPAPESPAAQPSATQQAATPSPEQAAAKLAAAMDIMKRDGVLCDADEFPERWGSDRENAALMFECLDLTRRGVMTAGDFPWIVNAIALYSERKEATMPGEVLDLLLAAGADANAADPQDSSMGFSSRRSYSVEIIGGSDSRDVPPLALVSSSPELCRKLLDAGADPNPKLPEKAGVFLARFLHEKAAESLEMLLAAGADPNVPDEDGCVPLHGAAFRGRAELCRKLLAAGANVNVCSKEQAPTEDSPARVARTPLDFAFQSLEVETARVLLEAGGECRNSEFTPFFQACFLGDVEEVRKLIAAGADVNKSIGRFSPLVLAAYLGHTDVCAELIKAGASLEKGNMKGEDRQLPLHAAVVGKRPAVCKLLLDAGVPADARDDDGVTPLVLASMWGDEEIVDMLLAAGADANASDAEKAPPLAVAVRSGRVGIVRKLLAAGANPKHMVNGESLLMGAAYSGEAEICKMLLDAGLDVNATDSRGMTPLHTAVWSRKKNAAEVCKLLLASGANPAARDSDGETPLLVSMRFRADDKVCRALIEAKAGIDEPNEEGMAPALRAYKDGRMDICELMIKSGAEMDDEDETGQKLFDEAVKNAELSLCQALMDAGVQPKGWPKLHLAALLGRLDEVKALLAQGGLSINQLFKNHTALTYAAHMGHSEICRELIAAGAEVNLKEPKGWAPLLAAIDGRHVDTCRVLIDAGADVDAELKGGLPALILAVQQQQPQIVRALLDAGADVRDRDPYESRTALHWAATLPGMGSTCNVLIDAGLDVNSTTIRSRETPLHCAVRCLPSRGLDSPIARRLLAAGANKELKNKEGKTAADLGGKDKGGFFMIIGGHVSF